MKQRTLFQSTKLFVNMTTDVAVIGGSIALDKMKAIKASGVREDAVENATEVEENLDICDSRLDSLEARLAEKGLSPRRKQRILRTIAVWEATATTVEGTVKL